jgi:hypothetical protein
MREIEIAVGDSSAAELAEEFRRANIVARGGTADVLDGIRAVLNVIRGADKKIGMLIHPRCKNFIQELNEDYRMPEGSEDRAGKILPVKKFDHGPDAFRYWNNLRGRRL